MINADNQFIDIVGLKIGWSPEPIRPIRRAFETPFTDMWVRCQREGAIRRSAHPRDAIDMAGSVRNGERRLQMLTMVVAGFCTGAVDAEALVHDMVVSGKLKARTSF
ncbi:hypothetical protein [Nesterenkonia pannonica]|uniref:hypothetical protein n=1 Tax=Nesterenkonia pannonica TaxID=1548602 RepID=UPI0021647137|nr:hypothetical protein [Nesterenkonia pannonica]